MNEPQASVERRLFWPLLLHHETRCDATRCDAIHRNKTKTNTTTTTAIKKGNTKSRSNRRRSSHTESFFFYKRIESPRPRRPRNKQSKVQSEYFVHVMFNYSGRRKRRKDRIGSTSLIVVKRYLPPSRRSAFCAAPIPPSFCNSKRRNKESTQKVNNQHSHPPQRNAVQRRSTKTKAKRSSLISRFFPSDLDDDPMPFSCFFAVAAAAAGGVTHFTTLVAAASYSIHLGCTRSHSLQRRIQKEKRREERRARTRT